MAQNKAIDKIAVDDHDNIAQASIERDGVRVQLETFDNAPPCVWVYQDGEIVSSLEVNDILNVAKIKG